MEIGRGTIALSCRRLKDKALASPLPETNLPAAAADKCHRKTAIGPYARVAGLAGGGNR